MPNDPTGLRAQLDIINQQERNLRLELKNARALGDPDYVRAVEQRIQSNENVFRGVQKALRELTRGGER